MPSNSGTTKACAHDKAKIAASAARIPSARPRASTGIRTAGRATSDASATAPGCSPARAGSAVPIEAGMAAGFTVHAGAPWARKAVDTAWCPAAVNAPASHECTEQCTHTGGDRHRQRAPKVTRPAPIQAPAPPTRAAIAPSKARKTSDVPDTQGIIPCAGASAVTASGSTALSREAGRTGRR